MHALMIFFSEVKGVNILFSVLAHCADGTVPSPVRGGIRACRT